VSARATKFVQKMHLFFFNFQVLLILIVKLAEQLHASMQTRRSALVNWWADKFEHGSATL